MSFYRKYRPQKFNDLIGQEHIVQTISNALKGGSFSHAYLFSGPKGSGKTTTARLLAKALNCQGREITGEVYEPCNKCVICKEITLGNNLDIIEIDAASNRGIDEIRYLRDKIKFAPSKAKYKVYIIDECHMLTKEAFNALLKTLEEPPEHAVFILATTEIHKIPATILSRTQSFEFKKASHEETLKLLKKIVKAENINIDDESLNLLSHLSYGAYRDALSMLDQVAALGIDRRHRIKLEETQLVLGQTTESQVWEFAQKLTSGNREEALKIVDEIYRDGKDLENFVFQVVSIFRKVLLLKEGITTYEGSAQDKKMLEEMANVLELEEIIFIMEKLTEIINKVKTSILGQLPLEMAVFQIIQKSKIKNQNCTPEGNSKLKTEEKSETIEHKITIPEPVAISARTSASEQAPVLETVPVVPFSPDKWPDIIKEVKAHNNTIAAMIKNTVFRDTANNHILLAVKFKFHAEQICAKKNLSVIESAVEKVTGKNYKVECVVDKDLDLKKPMEAEEEVLNGAKEVFEVEG